MYFHKLFYDSFKNTLHLCKRMVVDIENTCYCRMQKATGRVLDSTCLTPPRALKPRFSLTKNVDKLVMWIHTNGNMSFYKNGVPLKAKAQQLVPAARFPLRFVMATGSSPGGGYHRNVRWVWTPKNVCNYCFKKGVSSCDDVKATVHDSHGEHHSWLCKKNVPLRDVKYNGGTPYGVLKPSNTSARGVVQYFVSEHRSPPLPPSPLLHPACFTPGASGWRGALPRASLQPVQAPVGAQHDVRDVDGGVRHALHRKLPGDGVCQVAHQQHRRLQTAGQGPLHHLQGHEPCWRHAARQGQVRQRLQVLCGHEPGEAGAAGAAQHALRHPQ